MNWAKEVAMRIIEERPNEEVYTVASGVSPSGFVHIGNFREIATPYLVAKELRKLGKKVRYILSFDEDCIWHYATLRHQLQQQGKPIGSLDMLIAAHTLSLDATLITNNVAEFERVNGLRVENWV